VHIFKRPLILGCCYIPPAGSRSSLDNSLHRINGIGSIACLSPGQKARHRAQLIGRNHRPKFILEGVEVEIQELPVALQQVYQWNEYTQNVADCGNSENLYLLAKANLEHPPQAADQLNGHITREEVMTMLQNLCNGRPRLTRHAIRAFALCKAFQRGRRAYTQAHPSTKPDMPH